MTDDSTAEYAAHPQLAVISVMLRWFQSQPDESTYDWGNLDASLADARNHGYRLVIRIMCGGDAPMRAIPKIPKSSLHTRVYSFARSRANPAPRIS